MVSKGRILINVNDVIGKRLGKIKVIKYAGSYYDFTKGGLRMRHRYIVHCDCGVTKTIERGLIVSNNVKSCGCLKGRRKYVNKNENK